MGFLAIALLSITGSVWAQPPDIGIKDEPPGGALAAHAVLSPPARASVKIGSARISVAYSAPSKRKRVIFGGLERYHKVWRAGANDATALHTDADLNMEGLAIPKGDYTLFVWLDEKQWQLIVNRQTGRRGLSTTARATLAAFP